MSYSENVENERALACDLSFAVSCLECVYADKEANGMRCGKRGEVVNPLGWCTEGEKESDGRLLPCPFCGGRCAVTANAAPEPDERRRRLGKMLSPFSLTCSSHSVQCRDCGASMHGFRDEEEAVWAWNFRIAAFDRRIPPCPICGCDASLKASREKTGEHLSGLMWVECSSCGARGPASCIKSSLDPSMSAVEAWRKRDGVKR